MKLSRFTLLLFPLIAISCKTATMKTVEAASYPNLKEQRLGQSSYFVKFPSTMFIEEARGKEGQLGYGIWEIDSIKRHLGSSAFIEIEHGRPIGWEPDCDKSIEKVRSNLLNETIKWTVCESEARNYYSAIANHDKLFLEASSPTRSGLDSMIAIVATLSKK